MSTEPSEPHAESATVELLLTALGNEIRRDALAAIESSSAQTASLEELTDRVMARQDGSDRTYEQVRMRLHHVDLPKLAAVGLLEYDPRTSTVRIRSGTPAERWRDVVRGVEETA